MGHGIAIKETILTDICIIGAGSGGLSVAAGASQMGADVVLIEKGKMGGDCLNTGCIPSKALLAAAKTAQTHRSSSKFGVKSHDPKINFKDVLTHVKEIINTIAPHDSKERFESLSVNVIKELGVFIDSKTVKAGHSLIRAKRFVIATGSHALIPPIQGLKETPYLTNETIFNQTECPEHLIIIGGGPIGMEMAQAHQRLGAKVTVIDKVIMPHDDSELVSIMKKNLAKEGVNFIEGNFVETVSKAGEIITVKTNAATIKGSDLLIATGRAPNLKALGLDQGNIKHTSKGIQVNTRLQTSIKHIYAIGDCIGHLQFTHVAGYHAGIVIRNILFKLPAKIDISISPMTIPWVTYCDPELAHVGLNEEQARGKFGKKTQVLRFPFSENDRAITERNTEGLIKVICTTKGKILGCSIVGLGAGDLIFPWVIAIQNGLKLGQMANTITPYPTRSESSKRISGSFFTPKLYDPLTKKIVRFLLKWLH